MESKEAVIILASIGVLLTTLGSVVVNVIAALAAKQTSRQVAVVGGAVAEVRVEQRQIAHSVNSTASAAAARIELLQAELVQLRQVLGEAEKRAALLAQSTAARRAADEHPAAAE